MRGKLAKKIRRAAEYNHKKWRNQHPNRKYDIKVHELQRWDFSQTPPKRVIEKAFQIRCIGTRGYYKTLKKIYKGLL